MIEIVVNDTGIGIKEEDQDKLFKLFGSLKSTK
jgi:signal transduction histidine kinase